MYRIYITSRYGASWSVCYASEAEALARFREAVAAARDDMRRALRRGLLDDGAEPDRTRIRLLAEPANERDLRALTDRGVARDPDAQGDREYVLAVEDVCLGLHEALEPGEGLTYAGKGLWRVAGPDTTPWHRDKRSTKHSRTPRRKETTTT